MVRVMETSRYKKSRKYRPRKLENDDRYKEDEKANRNQMNDTNRDQITETMYKR